jgi:hypothetical protein
MRGASLDYIVEHGGIITNAVSSQDWPGDAAVDVSVVNWIKKPGGELPRLVLDGVPVENITTSLRAGADIHDAQPLAPNLRFCFQGPQPVGKGFLLDPAEARAFIERHGDKYRDVVRPYLVGNDITTVPGATASRYVIDFAVRPLEDAMEYPAALDIVRERVKPERETNRDKFRRENWWLLGRPVVSMRQALEPCKRYIAVNAVGKRLFFVWADKWTCPSNKAYAIAFDDDFAFGVLTSSINIGWSVAQSATLEDRIAYTPTSAFETFPWPDADDNTRSRIGRVAQALDDRRRAVCLEREIGLTTLYNQMDDGAWSDLKALHAELDEAVAAAYGWPKSAAHDPDESNRLLLGLNMRIALEEVAYAPFGDTEGDH